MQLDVLILRLGSDLEGVKDLPGKGFSGGTTGGRGGAMLLE